MATGFDKLIEDFEKEMTREGIFSDVEKHKISKFIGLNKSKVLAAIKLYKELEEIKNSGDYDHAKSPLVIASDVTGLSPKVLAYELENQGMVTEVVLEQYLIKESEEMDVKVATLEDFVIDLYTIGTGTVSYRVLDDGSVEYSISVSEEKNDANGRYATMKTKPSGYLKGQRFVG